MHRHHLCLQRIAQLSTYGRLLRPVLNVAVCLRCAFGVLVQALFQNSLRLAKAAQSVTIRPIKEKDVVISGREGGDMAVRWQGRVQLRSCQQHGQAKGTPCCVEIMRTYFNRCCSESCVVLHHVFSCTPGLKSPVNAWW